MVGVVARVAGCGVLMGVYSNGVHTVTSCSTQERLLSVCTGASSVCDLFSRLRVTATNLSAVYTLLCYTRRCVSYVAARIFAALRSAPGGVIHSHERRVWRVPRRVTTDTALSVVLHRPFVTRLLCRFSSAELDAILCRSLAEVVPCQL